MRVFCVQLDIVWENKPANFRKVVELLAGVEVPSGSLILLPEMFATGFSMNKEEISQDEPQQTEAFLSELARSYCSYTLGGLVTRAPDGRGRNLAVLSDPEGTILTRYQKLHPFSYGGEDKHYESGSRVVTVPVRDLTVAPIICYDLRFPEIFRHTVQQGANLFAVIACFPAAREEHWTALLKARAIENQAYVAAVNRCGDDPKLHYSGHSRILDPWGNVLAEAGSVEGIVSAEIDLAALQQYRRDFPALADIRDDYRYR